MNNLKNRLQEIWRRIRGVRGLKYYVAALVFILTLMLGRDNNFFTRIRNDREIRTLNKEIKRYESEIEENRRRLEELDSDRENLEKFAREKCHFKAADEDVFVVVDD